MHAVAAFFASIITFVSGFFAPTVASNSPVDVRTMQPAAAAAAQTDIVGDPFNDPDAASAVTAAIPATVPASAFSPPPAPTVINQPVIERIIERIVPQGGTISAETLAAILADFEQSISNRLAALNPPPAAIPAQVAAGGNSGSYTFSPASQRIDQLTNTAINTPTITGGSISGASVSGYLPLSGGALTGTLSGTDLTLSGALSAGALNVSSIASAGALTGPYFTATSTTATSSFAGGLTAADGSLSILQNGNVGIGTESPSRRLHVYDPVNAYGLIQGGNLGGLLFQGTTTSTGQPAYANINTYTDGSLRMQASSVGWVAASNQLTLANSGNVGIGTTTPWGKLSIKGSGTGTGLAFAVADSANTPRFVIQDNGYVGIGTTSPETKLHVYGSGGADFPLIVQNDFTGAGASANLELRNGTAVQDSLRMLALGQGFTTNGAFTQDAGVISAEAFLSGGLNLLTRANAPIRFYTNGHGNERMRITEGGNIGIGTTTPGGILEVGNTSSSGIVSNFTNGNNSTIAYTELGVRNGYTVGNNADALRLLTFGTGWTTIGGYLQDGAALEAGVNLAGGLSMVARNSAGVLRFYTGGQADSNERMRITSSGNVGIGTTTPSVPFHVVSTSIPQARIAYDSSNYTDVRYDGFNTVGGAQTFLNAGSEKMRISSAGNVGIGTTTPGSILHLESSLPILSLNTNTSGNSARINFRSNNALTSVITADFTDNSLQFFNNGATRLYIGNTGNVGIGTSTPQTLLDISKAGSGTTITSGSPATLSITNPNSTNNNFADLFFSTIDTSGTTAVGSKITGVFTSHTAGAMTSDIAFLTRNTSLAERMRITSSGNVGIGTTSPDERLTVEESGTDHANITINQGNASSAYDSYLIFEKQGSVVGTVGYDAGDSVLKINNSANWAGVNHLAISASGNVGIGTTTPSVLLTVAGSSGEVARFDSTNANGVYTSWTTGSPGNNLNGLIGSALPLAEAGFSVSDFAVRARNNLLFIANGGISNRYMMWTNAGYLGIGTTSPTAQLHTTGTVRFSNFGAGTLTTDASGNLSVSSDERLKNIDGEFTRGLADIVKLTPISYHWNDISGLDKSTQYAGFSAQNVQTAIPEAVGSSTIGYLTLQDRPLIATIVNAIKELAHQVTDLAERVVTKEIVATNGRFDRLCVGSTCVTEEQFMAMVAAAGQSTGSPSASVPAGMLQAPVIELNGNASSTIELGDTYNDLGARILAPESDLNLGIVIVLDGANTTEVSIDTSAPGDHTILYTVTSPTTGLTGSIMRTVTVSSAEELTVPAEEDTNPFNAPDPANDNASSTHVLIAS
ncbi:MAG: immunoglobulin-like domain-containing protein [Methylocystis silviterrae]|uniref:immunoglobulin-like domain-containing protein n=1 Tax=Methylocystis silviterrae TaxID=2743612 RepID=UPI003C7928E6